MCLATIQEESKIAKRDITTYKFLDGLLSPYQCFEYKLNKLYKVKMTIVKDDGCYDSIAIAGVTKREKAGKKAKIKYIESGFHSIRTLKRVKKCKEGRNTLYKCVIPKGSKYYIDNTDLIVSNKIKIIKEHEL